MAGKKGRSGGHNRKSIAELNLQGTYRADRHGGVLVPEDERERVVPQEHITNNSAKVDREQVFNWFADILHEQGMTQKIDSILLSQLVQAHSLYVTALSFAHADPEAMLGRKLASSVALEAGREVRSLMSEFRLTPTSRTIKLGDVEVPDDPVAAFLDARPVN